jgi:hypothetical protein
MKKARVTGEQVFFVPVTLPGFNEILQAMRTKSKRRGKSGRKWYKWTEMKKEYESIIISAINASGIQPVKRAYFIFTFIEKNKKRDPDNVAAGARKLILDALQRTDPPILKNDGWACVAGWHDSFSVRTGKHQKAGVGVQIFPDGG